MVSPLYAANNMIRRANEQEGVGLTNLKLQKLLYVLYAKYYYETDVSLFPDRFEAWQYGPVLTKVYDVFKLEGPNPITDMRPDPNGKVMVISEAGHFGECFDYIWSSYAHKPASYLVGLTHGKENPGYETAWRRAVTSNGGGYGAFIKDEDIKEDGEKWFAGGSK